MTRFASLVACLLAAVSSPIAAEEAVASGGSVEITASTIGAGGGTSSGGPYAVSGTIGQADADASGPATGGTYAVTGGFPATAASAVGAVDPLFSNGFE